MTTTQHQNLHHSHYGGATRAVNHQRRQHPTRGTPRPSNRFLGWSKIVDILDAYTVGGGFEVWAQIEIAMAVCRWCQFNGLAPNTLQREAPVFAANNQLTVYFAITNPAFPYIVELKVEGSNPNADNATTFAKGLDAGIAKLIEKKVKPDWSDHPGLAVGISCTAQAAQATEDIFQHQGDKPLRINTPNTPIAV
jgi:hypothetical protein